MLDRLLESGARGKKSAWGGTASVIIHSAIIALAVFGTATADPGIPFDRGYIRLIPLHPPVDERAGGRPVGVRKVEPARRRPGQLAHLVGVVVRRDDVGKDGDEVQHDEDEQSDHARAVAAVSAL